MRVGRRYQVGAAALVIALAVALALLTERARQWPYESVGDRELDATFVARILTIDEDTLTLARLAETYAEHPELRRLAREMIRTIEDDGARMGVMKAEMPRLSDPIVLTRAPDERAALIAAPSFDKAFIEVMAARYERTLELCRSAARSARTADVRWLASDLVASRARDLVVMRLYYDDWYGS